MEKVRAGVIGLGLKGYRYDVEGKVRQRPDTHVGALQGNPDVVLVAVCDTDPEKRAFFSERHPDIPMYDAFEKMLYESKLDLLCIATPVADHCRLVRLSCRYLNIKAILVEKPIAETVEQAWSMVQTCAYYKVVLAVNHQRRWDSFWRKAHSMVTRTVGCPQFAVGLCGGDPVEAGVHMADLFHWFAPQAQYRYVDLKGKKPYDPSIVFDLYLYGPKGKMAIGGNGTWVEPYTLVPSIRWDGLVELVNGPKLFQEDMKLPLKRREAGAEVGLPYTPMENVVADLVKCVRTGSKPRCTGADGVKALQTCLKWAPKEVAP